MIKEAYIAGEEAALEKVAAPRWIKKLQDEALFPSAIKKLEGMGLPERTIKHLGTGSYQIADLVMHPKHGLSVRKIPLLTSTEHIAQRKASAMDDFSNWEKVKKITKGEGPFAHIKGSEGPIGHFQYVSRSPKDYNSRLEIAYKKAKRHSNFLTRSEGIDVAKFQKLRRSGAEDKASPELNRAIDKIYARNLVRRERELALRLAQDKKLPFSSKDQSYISKVKKKYPDLWDHDVPRNIIDGKIVDASFTRGGTSTIQDVPYYKQDTYSRKNILGNRDKSPPKSGSKGSPPVTSKDSNNLLWGTPGSAGLLGAGGIIYANYGEGK